MDKQSGKIIVRYLGYNSNVQLYKRDAETAKAILCNVIWTGTEYRREEKWIPKSQIEEEGYDEQTKEHYIVFSEWYYINHINGYLIGIDDDE
jgi:hypothetical protein